MSVQSNIMNSIKLCRVLKGIVFCEEIIYKNSRLNAKVNKVISKNNFFQISLFCWWDYDMLQNIINK